MSERALRGSRLGATSYETDAGIDLAPRQNVAYDCPKGHHIEVPVRGRGRHPAGVGVPVLWRCRQAGRRRAAGGEEGQAAAHPLGHAHGAPHGRGPRRGARRAPGGSARRRHSLDRRGAAQERLTRLESDGRVRPSSGDAAVLMSSGVVVAAVDLAGDDPPDRQDRAVESRSASAPRTAGRSPRPAGVGRSAG